MNDDAILGTSGKDALPFEYQAQEQAAGRKRAFAQMMLQKGMAPQEAPQFVGNRYVRRSPLEGLNKALQMYLGTQGLADADTEKQGVLTRAAADQKGQIANFMALQQGKPGAPIMGEAPRPSMDAMGPMPGAQVGTGPAQPGDIKGAIAAALGSPFPHLQTMGQQLQKNEWANDTQRATFGQEDKIQQAKFGQENSILDKKQSWERQDKMGQLYGTHDPQVGAGIMQNGLPNGVAPEVRPGEAQFIRDPKGRIIMQSKDHSGMAPTSVYEPSSVNVSNHVNVEAQKANTMLEKLATGRVEEGLKNTADAPQQLSQLNRILDNINKGADQGPGATARQALRDYGQMLGVSTPQGGLTGANVNLYKEQILKNIRLLAPVSDKDIPVLEKMLGSADTNPATMKEMISRHKAMIAVQAGQLNQRIDQAAQVTAGDPAKWNQFKVPNLPMASGDKQNDARTKQMIRDAGGDVKQHPDLPDAPDVDYFSPGAQIYPKGSPAAAAAVRKGQVQGVPMPEGFTNRRKF